MYDVPTPRGAKRPRVSDFPSFWSAFQSMCSMKKGLDARYVRCHEIYGELPALVKIQEQLRLLYHGLLVVAALLPEH